MTKEEHIRKSALAIMDELEYMEDIVEGHTYGGEIPYKEREALEKIMMTLGGIAVRIEAIIRDESWKFGI